MNITKAETARRWKVDPSMVTKYIRGGLPVGADGKIDWEKAQKWRKTYIVPEKSGNHRHRQQQKEKTQQKRGYRQTAKVSDYDQGVVDGWAQARNLLRGHPTEWLNQDGLTAEQALERVITLAYVDLLLGNGDGIWEFPESLVATEPSNWNPIPGEEFPIAAAEAKRIFAEVTDWMRDPNNYPGDYSWKPGLRAQASQDAPEDSSRRVDTPETHSGDGNANLQVGQRPRKGK